MGNAACCQGDTGDTTAGEFSATATNKPSRKAAAGPGTEFEAGSTIRGLDIKQAISLQAALRGYLARRMVGSGFRVFKPHRDDIKELKVENVPNFSTPVTREALKRAGTFTKPEQSDDGHDVWSYSPVEFTDGTFYEGQWSGDSKRHGYGRQVWPNGRVYEGYWANDEITGKGRLIYENGDIYTGSLKSGKKHGQGILLEATGDRYEGDWEDDLKNGRGRELFSDKRTYEGQYAQGKFHGQGKLFLPHENSTYEGNWNQGEKQGRGKITWADRRAYDGLWHRNKKHGEGLWIDNDIKTKGEWNQDRRVRWL